MSTDRLDRRRRPVRPDPVNEIERGVQNGMITRGSKVRFLRDGAIIWKGTVSSLKRFTDDVREVQSGFECGIGLSNFQDLKAGDIIETFTEREVARTLEG